MTTATRFNEAGDRVSYVPGPGNPPDPPFTILMWVYLSVDSGTDTSLYRRYTSGGSSRGQLATSGNGTSLFWFPSSHDLDYDLTVTGWSRLAVVVHADNTITTYAAGPAGPMTVRTGSAGTTAGANQVTLGAISVGNGGQPFNGRMAYVRTLATALPDEAAVVAELASATGSAAWAHWPLGASPVPNNLLDTSGNARDLTAGSTPTTIEDGPPLSNTVIGSATVSLSAPTVAATGIRTVLGAAPVTLTAPTVTAAGQRTALGAATVALDGVEVDALGRRDVVGAATAALDGPTVTASGTRMVRGAATVALDGPTVTVIGARKVLGGAIALLPAPVVTGTGGRVVPGAALLALPAPAVTASGRRLVRGVATVQLPGIVMAATISDEHDVAVAARLAPQGRVWSRIGPRRVLATLGRQR